MCGRNGYGCAFVVGRALAALAARVAQGGWFAPSGLCRGLGAGLEAGHFS